MGAQENAELIRRGYEAFNSGDMTALAELIDEGVRWHSPGRSPVAGDYEGRDATFAYFGRLAQETGGTFRAQLRDVVAGEELVIGLHHNHAERDGRTLDVDISLVFRLRNGKVVEAWEYYDDLYSWDEFWS